MRANGKRRKWSAADKLRIVLTGMQPNGEVSDLCRREGINPTQYSGWKKQLQSSASKIFDEAANQPSAREERQAQELLDARGVPQAHRAVLAGAGQAAAVRAPGYAPDPACVPLKRIFAGFLGCFLTQESGQGYGTPAMHSHSLDVSTSDDYLRQWEHVRAGIREAGLIAQDYGVTLALQNHPPITNNTEETLEMIEEVGLDNGKMGLDLPLLERHNDESFRRVVHEVGGRMVHSRITAIRFKETLVGVAGFDEVGVGEERESFPAFLRACGEIGYDGFLGYEQCSPIILKRHKKGTLKEVDRRNQACVAHVRNRVQELGLYTGKRRAAEAAVSG
jgi:transposase-like protein